MRKIHILFCLSFLLIFGCLEDEGNYDYEDIKEPKWYTDQPISVYATEHDMMKLRGREALGGRLILFNEKKRCVMNGD